LTLKARPARQLSATFDVTDLWDATSVVNGAATRADFQPPFLMNVGLEHLIGMGNIGYGAQYHLQGSHTESSAGPGKFGAYNTADIYAKLRVARGSYVTARIKNLTNERYGSYYAFPQPGRTWRIEWATR
jgi:outer membrane receptor protein involved in Fe transport